MTIEKIQSGKLPLQGNSNNSVLNTKNEKSIGDRLRETTQTAVTIKGEGADVSVDEKFSPSTVPGFMSKKVTIHIPGSEAFSVNMHVAKNVNPEQVEKITEKLTRTISNLPQDFLEDFGKECTNLLIVPDIPMEKRAVAHTIGKLNQIFISASHFDKMSDTEYAEVLVHETGHLIDQSNDGMVGKASKWWNKEFKNLKSVITEDLGFDTKTHSLDNTGELFADYYLNKKMQTSENHRSNKLFDLLKQYNDDVNTLSAEELQDKYGENTDKIIDVAKNWNELKNCFEYYLGNLESGTCERMQPDVEPMSHEQIKEHDQQVRANNFAE